LFLPELFSEGFPEALPVSVLLLVFTITRRTLHGMNRNEKKCHQGQHPCFQLNVHIKCMQQKGEQWSMCILADYAATEVRIICILEQR
jgi:hypothetical protein